MEQGFGSLDYGIVFIYLIFTTALGIVLGRGQKNIQDYFLAARKLPWWAISGSIVATETSTLTFIGIPALAYSGNFAFLQVAMGYLFGRVLVSLLLIPSYFKGEIQTAYQLLHSRFGLRTRTLSAGIFLITRSFADGVRVYATALVLAVITAWSDLTTVALIGLFTIVYTYYGGMVSVVWNDVIQLAIYLAGALLALWVVVNRVPGGWESASALAASAGKFQIFDFTLDATTALTFWAGIVGGTFLTLATHGTDQMMVQRYLSCARQRDSQLALIVSGGVVFLQFALFLLLGALLYAYYQHFPLGKPLEQADRIFPTFIVQEMPQGVSGLVIAAIFAAAMSTLSSSLNSLSSSSLNDFYRIFWMREASERHYLQVSRILTLFWAGVLSVIALMARNWGSVLVSGLTITSITMGSVLGVFILGFRKSVPQNAALAGMAVGVGGMLVVQAIGGLAWTWYVLAGTSATVLVGIVWGRMRSLNP
ncbi:MAG: sodium/solute symporter [Acidobacteria bacterium]|nr:sodium/solute symporter [Acidobacteriota bacterium]